MGKIIAFVNQKGGVGKTTTCMNMAAFLAIARKKVLLVDIDPQGNASTGVGADKKSFSIYNLLCGDTDINEPQLIQKTMIENLFILPANVDLGGAEVELAQRKDSRETVLKRAFGKIKGNYDYIMIDCPPSVGLLTVNALTAADSVMIPIQCEFFALEGLSQLLNTIRLIRVHLNPTLEIDGVILTLFSGKSRLSQQVAQEVANYFGDRLYKTAIPRNIALAEAPSYGLPVAVYKKQSKGSKAYAELTVEFLKREAGMTYEPEAEREPTPAVKVEQDATLEVKEEQNFETVEKAQFEAGKAEAAEDSGIAKKSRTKTASAKGSKKANKRS